MSRTWSCRTTATARGSRSPSTCARSLIRDARGARSRTMRSRRPLRGAPRHRQEAAFVSALRSFAEAAERGHDEDGAADRPHQPKSGREIADMVNHKEGQERLMKQVKRERQ